MKIIEIVSVDTVVAHLKTRSSAVSLPWTLSEYQVFHVEMEQGDESRIVLWWENENATKHRNCRLVDSFESAGDKSRVDSFIYGDGNRFGPINLQTSPCLAPVAVTDNPNGNFWYLIDGSHRSIAQFRSKKSFEGVQIFVCVHPQIMNWPNIPSYYKQLSGQNASGPV